jgi:hypothetical protein
VNDEPETRTREELIAALTAGAGLLAQAFSVLGGALHRAAQAFEDLAKVIENQILTDMENEFVPLETESDDLDDPEGYVDDDGGEPPVNP